MFTGWICLTCSWKLKHGRTEAIDHANEGEGHEVGWLINGEVFEPLKSPLVKNRKAGFRENPEPTVCRRDAFGNYYTCILTYRSICPDALQRSCMNNSYKPQPKHATLTDFF